jgi:hypothetical protein
MSIGDNGQRYMLEAFSYPKEGVWNPILYTPHFEKAQMAGAALMLAPSCESFRVIDRHIGEEVKHALEGHTPQSSGSRSVAHR